MSAPPSISAMSPQKPGEFSAAMEKAGVVHHQRHWVPDQRDAFIGWLRGEFAAANAMIDALCQHLQLIGAPGEYDFVLGSIQQRRFSWNGVLHMQQYFSVAEVLFSLQQVIMRKQQHQQQHQHQHQLLPNGNGKPSQQKAYTQNGNHVGDSRARRDFSANARKQPERPKARNVPAASANENGRKEGECRGGFKVAGSLENFANASPAPVPQQQDKLPGHPQQGIVEETSKHEESPVQLKGAEVATVEVVETGQRKVNVAEGQLYNHVFGESKRAELTEILERTPGDQSCIKGKLKTSAAEGNASQPQEESPRTIAECVQSVVDHLSGEGILSGAARPNYFTLHVIKEGKSVSFEDQVQPLYLVSLLSEPSLVLGKRGTNVLKGAPTLSIPAGSLLKFEASNTTNAVSYAVNVDTSKRILIFLGCEQEERSPGLASTAKPSSGSSKKSHPSSSNCGKSTSPAASSCSSLQSWQARPGTGVYIPNSTSSKCDIVMNYRACIQT